MMFIPKRIDDPLFGSMKLVDDENCYQGSVLFTPLKQQIEITAYSSSYGPTKNQRLLFREIEQKYFECAEKIPAFIEKAFPTKGRPLTMFEFTKEFELIGIIIHDLSQNKATWEIEYTTEGLDGWVTIQFIDWEPCNFSFDQ